MKEVLQEASGFFVRWPEKCVKVKDRKREVTNLIQKNKDKTAPANERPVSLLNGDYKLFTKYMNKHFIQRHLVLCRDDQSTTV